MEYMKVAQAAEQWGISDRRVRILCQQGKIEGVLQKRSSAIYLGRKISSIRETQR